MPPCSVCGYAVEWVRNTYASAWALFRDRTDVLTRGQYVRCPFGTPHYSDFHNLGSANWRRGTDEQEPPLGEPLNQRQTWTRSEPLPVFPLPLFIGDRNCISSGDNYSARVPEDAVFNGFLLRCWRDYNPALVARLSDIPLSLRTTLISHANIENLLYDDVPGATAAVIALLGPGTTVIVQGDNLTQATPRTMIATNGAVTLVFISGTTTAQQIALQGMFSLVPPQYQAGYGTNPVWNAAMNTVAQRIVDSGVSLDTEIRLVGHSYGGAIATLLAANMKRFQPGRTIELLTFGAPKVGDDRLGALLVNVPSMAIANDGDPIPSLAPATAWTIPFSGEILQVILDGWAAYVTNPNQFILDVQGHLTATSGVTFNLLQLGQLIIDALTSTPPAAIAAHSMAEYYTRLLLPP